MENEKLKTLKELIDSFDKDYYEKQNKKLMKEINNIRMGMPRYDGIYDLVDSDIVPKNKREEEIKKLQNQIKDNTQNLKELNQALIQLKMLSDRLEKLASQEILIDTLNYQLRFNSERSKTSIHKKNEKKYSKLYISSIKPITQNKQKISKDLYEIIKKNMNKLAYETPIGYKSINFALKDNRIDLQDKLDPGKEIFVDYQKKYMGFSNYEEIAKLGVDINILEYAKEQLESKLDFNSLTWQGVEVLEKLKSIEKVQSTNINIKGGYSKLKEIEEKYLEIEELSRETWYLNEVLRAFANTNITNTEIYKGLEELINEQKLEITKLVRNVDKLYENTGLRNKIDLVEHLDRLYNKTKELRLKINQFKLAGNEKEANLIEQEYYNVRYEMIKILKDNPDLNNSEYNIDIEKVIEQEMKLFEPEIKKEILNDFKNLEDKNNEMKSELIDEAKENIEEIPTYVQTKEEEIFIEKAYNENTNVLEILENDSNLQIQRTMHYQNYMREKVINSELGKLPFSMYLEAAAPNLVQLIKIEKERERLAKTIYKDYLKYYSALKNKQDAIEFSEFSKNKYGISNIDVPVEYDEEYKGMMKR